MHPAVVIHPGKRVMEFMYRIKDSTNASSNLDNYLRASASRRKNVISGKRYTRNKQKRQYASAFAIGVTTAEGQCSNLASRIQAACRQFVED